VEHIVGDKRNISEQIELPNIIKNIMMILK
jgi:hypothetical protein